MTLYLSGEDTSMTKYVLSYCILTEIAEGGQGKKYYFLVFGLFAFSVSPFVCYDGS